MDSLICIELWLSTAGSSVALDSTRFVHPQLDAPRASLRGGVAARGASGTFSWSAAVRGLVVLLLRVARLERESRQGLTPVLEGGRGSLAASLDYALAKQPLWLLDMFGVDRDGQALFRRLVRIVNPNQKRPGPVTVKWSAGNGCRVRVYLDGAEVERLEEFERCALQIARAAPSTTRPTSPRVKSAAAKRIIFLSPAGDELPFYRDARRAFRGVMERYRPNELVGVSLAPKVDFSPLEYWAMFRAEIEEQDDVAGVLLIPDNADANVERMVSLYQSRKVPVQVLDVDFSRVHFAPSERSVLPPFVGGHELHGGEGAGHLLAAHVRGIAKLGEPRILILPGAATRWELGRVEGFRRGMQSVFRRAQFEEAPPLLYSRSRAAAYMRELAANIGESQRLPYDGIFACNDDMALGVEEVLVEMEACNPRRLKPHLRIVGYDGVGEMRAKLSRPNSERRFLLGTIDVHLQHQIELACSSLMELIHRGRSALTSSVTLLEPVVWRGGASEAQGLLNSMGRLRQ